MLASLSNFVIMAPATQTSSFYFSADVLKEYKRLVLITPFFNVPDVQDNHKILYFENLNLNGNLIDGLGDPVHLDSATNK